MPRILIKVANHKVTANPQQSSALFMLNYDKLIATPIVMAASRPLILKSYKF